LASEKINKNMPIMMIGKDATQKNWKSFNATM